MKSEAVPDSLLVDRTNLPALILRLNRPTVHNALDLDLITAISRSLEAAFEDPAVRAIVITGSGRSFCSGDDLKALRSDPIERFAETIDALQEVTTSLLRSPKPIIAALNGPAYGAGLELVLSCDVRIATPTFAAATPEVLLGLVATNGASVLLPLLVGQSAARVMLLGGEVQSASWSLTNGLIDEIVPDEVLLKRALEVAKELSNGAPRAVAATRSMLNASLEAALAQGLQREARSCIEARTTPECDEGIAAHFAGRKPSWLANEQ